MNHPDLPAGFADVTLLGEGAFGRVYRAIDPEGRPVALKVLSGHQPEAAWQFEAEFRHLSRLDHPAFPRAYAQGRTPAGAPWFTMALVEGKALDAGAPLSAHAVRDRLAALASALAYLHGTGYVHGDLKPENVRLTPEGGLVLLDLGLMAPVGARRAGIEGTLEYLAPEAFRQHPAAPAADMYALGAIAYALWSGAPPFTGAPAALVRAHVAAPVPALAGKGAEADAELETLILRLLAKDPAERPSARALTAMLAGEPVPEADDVAGLAYGAFVGREALTDAWSRALAAAAPSTLAFTAESGLGKSRALDECRLAARLAGRAWLQAACLGANEAPGAPMRALVAQALGLSGEAAGPILASWLKGEVAPAIAALEPASRQVAVGTAAAGALAAAVRQVGPLAVGLDDWQHADPASVAILAHLQRVEGAVAWAIAGTAVPGLSADLTLAPLEPADSAELVASRLGQAPPEGLVTALVPASGGSPRLIEMLLEHLVTQGTLRRQGGEWRLTAALGAGAMPASLEAALVARFERLGAEARRLAGVLAVAAPAGPLPVPVIEAAAQLGPEPLASALAALVADGAVAEVDGRFRLALAETGAALLATVSASTRAEWARAMAIALAPEGANSPVATLVGAAWLAVASGDAALALPLVAEAARRGLALGGPGQALALLEAADALDAREAAPEVRLAMTFSRAEAERFLDKLEPARAHYEEAIAEAEGATRAGAWIGLGKCRQLGGDLAGAREAYAAAAQAAREAGEGALEGRAAASEARALALQGDSAAGEARAASAASIAEAAGAAGIRAQALLLEGYLIVQRDPQAADVALARLEEALALARGIGDRVGEAQSHDNLGNVYLSLGRLKEADASFAAYAALCESAGLATEALAAGMNGALVAAERGDVEKAGRLAAETRRRAEAVGRKFVAAVAATAAAKAHWMAGEPDKAAEPLERALETAVAIKSVLLEEHVRAYRLEARLASGRAEAVREEAEAIAPLIAKTGHVEMQQKLDVALAEAAWLEGDAAAATAGAKAGLSVTSLVVKHRAWRLLAQVALAGGDAAGAVAAAREAIAIAEGWAADWHRADDGVLLAAALAAAGNEEAAREAALSALDTAHENPQARAAAAALLGQAPAAPAVALGGLDGVALARAMAEIAVAADEGAIARTALASALALTGADRGYWLSYDQGRLRQALTHGMDLEDAEERGFSETLSMQALVSGEPLYVMDAGADPRWQSSASVMGLALKTVICLPLVTPERILGVLYMDRQALDPLLTEADMAGLGALATVAAAAVFRARAVAEAQTGLAVMQALGAAVMAQVPAGALEAEVVKVAVATAGAERGFWLVPAGEGWSATAGVDAQGRAVAFAPGMVSQTIAAHVASSARPLAVLDVAESADFKAAASVMALGLRTIWCLPAGTPDGAIVYLDAESAPAGDPAEAIAPLETLLAHAAGLRG